MSSFSFASASFIYLFFFSGSAGLPSIDTHPEMVFFFSGLSDRRIFCSWRGSPSDSHELPILDMSPLLFSPSPWGEQLFLREMLQVTHNLPFVSPPAFSLARFSSSKGHCLQHFPRALPPVGNAVFDKETIQSQALPTSSGSFLPESPRLSWLFARLRARSPPTSPPPFCLAF